MQFQWFKNTDLHSFALLVIPYRNTRSSCWHNPLDITSRCFSTFTGNAIYGSQKMINLFEGDVITCNCSSKIFIGITPLSR